MTRSANLEEDRLVELAITAGLGRAVERCRDDVIAAALEARELRAALETSLTPADEPWPPMRVKTK